MREIATGYPATAGGFGHAIPNGGIDLCVPVIDGRRDVPRAETLAADIELSITEYGVVDLDFLLAQGWSHNELAEMLPESLHKAATARAELASKGEMLTTAAGILLAGLTAAFTGWQLFQDFSIPLV